MYLIRQLAKKYGLTRSALLHYDDIGLLTPATRTEVGYRLYSEEDEKRLQNILLFRSMGLSLDTIGQLLEDDPSRLANILLARLHELNQEIEALRQQQMNIIDLFKEVKTLDAFKLYGVYGENGELLFDGFDPVEWHQTFEAISPHLHQEFLNLLDLFPKSIRDAIEALLDSLPEDQRHRLNALIRKK